MPGARGRGERRLEDALADLAGALEESGAPWMVIGGIAIIARGVRRMTADIDAVVQGDAIGLDKLMKVLARWKIVPRIDKARDFARSSLVLLVRHRPTGVDLDVSLGWTAFEIEAISFRDRTAYGQVRVPMARAEDLVIFKTMAARPRDMQDAAALLLLHPDVDLARIRRRLGELAAMAEEPSLIDGLETVIAEAQATDRSGKRSVTARTPRDRAKARTKAPRKPRS